MSFFGFNTTLPGSRPGSRAKGDDKDALNDQTFGSDAMPTGNESGDELNDQTFNVDASELCAPLTPRMQLIFLS